MGLQQDAVDLFEIDGVDAVAHGLEQGADTEVAGAAQIAFGRADEETERLVVKVACGSATASSSRWMKRSMSSEASLGTRTE